MGCALRVAQKCSWPHFIQCIYGFSFWGVAEQGCWFFFWSSLTHSLVWSHMQQFKLQQNRRWKLLSGSQWCSVAGYERNRHHSWSCKPPHAPRSSLMFPIASWKKEEVNGEKWKYTAGSRMCTKQLPKINWASGAATRPHGSFLRVWISPSGLGAMCATVTWYMLLPAVFHLQMDWLSSYVSVTRG